MKIKTTPVLFVLLSLLAVLLFVRLWVGAGSLPEIWELEAQIERQTEQNTEQTERNKALATDVSGLSESGRKAIEDHARNELGMVKKNETFYQIILRDDASATVPVITHEPAAKQPE